MSEYMRVDSCIQLTRVTSNRSTKKQKVQIRKSRSSLRYPFLIWAGKTSVKDVIMLSSPTNWNNQKTLEELTDMAKNY